MFGKSIGGIIGYDFIEQFVVEIDYDAKVINLYAPASYKYSGSGDIVPIKFINKKPFVIAKIKPEGRDAIEGTFEIDTGADGAMVVNSPFVRTHRLLDSLTKIKQANLGGAGGTAKSITARVENVQLGRFVVRNRSSASRKPQRLGCAGELRWRSRRGNLPQVHIDSRLFAPENYFEPNAHLPESVEEDMSGIELGAEGEDFKTLVVNEVAANSPAAEAGLKEEDELTAIDRRPVSEFGLDRIRQMFKQEGKEYVLSIKRGQEIITTKIKLRRLI
jgi:hypothetical protein